MLLYLLPATYWAIAVHSINLTLHSFPLLRISGLTSLIWRSSLVLSAFLLRTLWLGSNLLLFLYSIQVRGSDSIVSFPCLVIVERCVALRLTKGAILCFHSVRYKFVWAAILICIRLSFETASGTVVWVRVLHNTWTLCEVHIECNGWFAVWMHRLFNIEIMVENNFLRFWLLDSLAEGWLLSLHERFVRRFPHYSEIWEVLIQDWVVPLLSRVFWNNLRLRSFQYLIDSEEVLIPQFPNRLTCVD